MISKMLVAIDHTESSQHALLQASALARSENSQVVLLSVVPSYDGDLRMMGKSKVLTQMRVPYQQALRDAEDIAKTFGLTLTSNLDEGEPFAQILALAEKERVDLIVVNKENSHPVDLVPLGAIASKVINQANADILVIPEDATLNLERLILLYSKSRDSETALNRAIELAVAYGGELTIVTTYEVPLEGFAYSPDLWDKTHLEAKQLQDSAKETAEKNGVRTVKTVLRHGKASREICNLAKEVEAGLIILGSKHRNVMNTYLPDNLVEQVIRNHTHPVWITKSVTKS